VLERAIEIRPGYSDARLLLGSAYLAAGRDAAARDLMRPLVQAEPTNHPAALQLAEALVRLDDLDGARTVLGQVMARAADATIRERARALLAQSTRLQRRRDTLTAAGLTPTVGPRPTITAAFRPVGPDEQRVYGVFQEVDCGPDGVMLVVRTATDLLRARADRLSDVEFIAYRELAATGVGCGEVTPPVEVYLTWRRTPDPQGRSDGAAVAIEMLPAGFVPAP
jgi:FimV-like protein